jgi:hypothetical protein
MFKMHRSSGFDKPDVKEIKSGIQALGRLRHQNSNLKVSLVNK